jgi:hypothetical protein
MKYADIIIPHGRSNTVAIEFVVENLKTKVPMDNLQEDFTQEGMQKQKSMKEQF